MRCIGLLMEEYARHAGFMQKYAELLAQIGITYFYYLRIEANGDSILLTSDPLIDDFYFLNKLYLEDPFLRHPDNYHSGFFSFDAKEGYDESLAIAAVCCELAPVMGFCEREENVVNFYGFWQDSRAHSDIDGRTKRILPPFIKYFKEEVRPVLCADTLPYISIEELIGSKFTESLAPGKDVISKENVQNYLRQIGLQKEVAKAQLLTPQEARCIKLLLKGKAAKETATALGLSFRTVEHYLDNVKKKWGCCYKNELFSIAQNLDELYLL